MPRGKGTYGSIVGRPPKKTKKVKSKKKKQLCLVKKHHLEKNLQVTIKK